MTHESNKAWSENENPYASSPVTMSPSSDPVTLNFPSWIAVICSVASLGLWLLALIVSLPYGNPNAPPLLEILSFVGMFMILPGLALAGAVSMLQRRRYGLALAGACCMTIPVLGPCFGLTLPLGIWTLVLLRRKSVHDAFFPSFYESPGDYSNPDDTLAAASALDRNGDWDAAIALYRFAAARWPEHATYISNCIDDIAKKQGTETYNGG